MIQSGSDRKLILDDLMSGRYDFDELTFRIFRYQHDHNPLYRQFCQYLGRSPGTIQDLSWIPFLPILFFKSHRVMTRHFDPELIFKSSATTESGRSTHLVRDRRLYEQISLSLFEDVYGPIEDYVILALLPSYLEQGDSSLIYMVRSFIERSGASESRFYRYDFNRLRKDLESLTTHPEKIILWGVTYALLDFAEEHNWNVTNRFFQGNDRIIMETGGMKGRREELLRSEVHQILTSNLHSGVIHSEYGMTEMLSQAYSRGKGVFHMGKTLRVLAYDPMDSLCPIGDDLTGRCHVIDLANLDSCSFIATDDLCRTSGGTFEIMGRLDNSDIRGCNLLYPYN